MNKTKEKTTLLVVPLERKVRTFFGEKTIKFLLFYSPLSWLAKIGSHLREMQMAYIFGEERVTVFHVFGIRNYPR